jgi:hypothetical protein
MRIFFALLVAGVGFLLSDSAVSATDYVTFDGTWWTSLAYDQQVDAIRALLAGYVTGYESGYIHAASNDNLMYHSTRSAAQLTGDPESHSAFSNNFGTYQQEVTDFYSTHQGSMDVLVADVVSCLADKPQFSCDQVAKYHSQ